METLWFCLVAVMITGYVVLDGFDLGAGIVHLFVARSDEEKRTVLASIGPVWDGNEVWLVAGGGTLYFAFPALYAASFSGFYLPLMIVLWLLIVRGISIEFRNHIASPVWTPVWDSGFAFASLLLAVFYGAALGNVVRRRSPRFRRLFFPPALGGFPRHIRCRHSRLVHDSHRSRRIAGAYHAWSFVGGDQVSRSCPRTSGFARPPRLVGSGGCHCRNHRGELRDPAASDPAVRSGALGICLPHHRSVGTAGRVFLQSATNRTARVPLFVRLSARDDNQRGVWALPSAASGKHRPRTEPDNR